MRAADSFFFSPPFNIEVKIVPNNAFAHMQYTSSGFLFDCIMANAVHNTHRTHTLTLTHTDSIFN